MMRHDQLVNILLVIFYFLLPYGYMFTLKDLKAEAFLIYDNIVNCIQISEYQSARGEIITNAMVKLINIVIIFYGIDNLVFIYLNARENLVKIVKHAVIVCDMGKLGYVF